MVNNGFEQAHIIIDRNAENDIKMRGLDAFIDDVFVDNLPYNSSFTDDLNPGEHTIRVTNHLYSRSLHVNIQAGQTLHLQVGNYFDLVGGIIMPSIGFGPYKVFVKEIDDDLQIPTPNDNPR